MEPPIRDSHHVLEVFGHFAEELADRLSGDLEATRGFDLGFARGFFDVQHTTSAAFKDMEIGQTVKPRRNASEPHGLRAARAKRRLWALVPHGHWSFGRKCPRHPSGIIRIAPTKASYFATIDCF
jgi:hypothetical protein